MSAHPAMTSGSRLSANEESQNHPNSKTELKCDLLGFSPSSRQKMFSVRHFLPGRRKKKEQIYFSYTSLSHDICDGDLCEQADDSDVDTVRGIFEGDEDDDDDDADDDDGDDEVRAESRDLRIEFRLL